MFLELLTADEIDRIEQDRKFYQYQEELQRAKLAAGVKVNTFDYDSQFNFIKRIDWLKKIEEHIQSRLNQSYEKQTFLTSNTPDFEVAKQLIYKEENIRKELHIFLAKIKAKISQIVSSRKGLPLLALHWKNYNNKIARTDYDLYFLSPGFQSYSEYIKPEFDEQDFSLIQDIYNSFLSPTELIHAFSLFLGVSEDRIMIACSNQRFNGFELWSSNNNCNFDNYIKSNWLSYIDFDNSFVLKYDNDYLEGFVNAEIFKEIDVWIDPLSLEIFVKKNTMPLKINRKIEYPQLLNVEYMPLVAFDYSDIPHKIDLSIITETISKISPTLIIRDIYAYNGAEFEKIPEGNESIWTFANLMVFSLNDDEINGRNSYIYNCETKSLNKFEYRQMFGFSDLVKLVSETLEFLRIPGFELQNPDDFFQNEI